MKQITKKEIQSGLDQLVGIRFLQEKDGRYKYHPNYKKTLLKCKGKTKEEILIDALCRSNYFAMPRTEREIHVVCSLLLLRKDGN